MSAAFHHLAYLLCATPRSGTTLLCDLLEATGQAGRPQSYYRRQDIESRASAWGLRSADFPDQAAFDRAYLSAVLRAGAAGTGIFGLRLMWGTVGELFERLAPLYPGATEAATLTQAFGPLVYIHVSRRDKVAQAISLLKAEQSGLWHVGADGADRQRIGPGGPVAYDADRIATFVAELERDDAAWNAFFDRHGLEPVRVAYEDLASSPRTEVRTLLLTLGRPPELADHLTARTSRMADAETERWAERFRTPPGA